MRQNRSTSEKRFTGNAGNVCTASRGGLSPAPAAAQGQGGGRQAAETRERCIDRFAEQQDAKFLCPQATATMLAFSDGLRCSTQCIPEAALSQGNHALPAATGRRQDPAALSRGNRGGPRYDGSREMLACLKRVWEAE